MKIKIQLLKFTLLALAVGLLPERGQAASPELNSFHEATKEKRNTRKAWWR